ncbi:four helix bundle protein [Tenacibaculum singaporense]|uniref:four helix bundle protein n=1 Tax=Tenacibaculum singaporense TaxID=2358479 RepID=UPI000F66E070|nr:four helix bundle protein [Tenacibaculum singaporense]RSC94874.1 four helix bundle protein [Tenacibaculum singaporense]
MGIKRFEDIIAWQKAQDFSLEVYKHFKSSKEYSFKDQITRASVSISNNIAEGFDRSSNQEFIRFLYYALGSNSEVRSMLYLAVRLEFIYKDKEKSTKLIHQSNEISRMIFGLIKSMKQN